MNTSVLRADDAQTEVITSTSPLQLCVAGPGSGKTFTLVERIKYLIREGVDTRKMVCITFTNAAANEISRRLDGAVMGYVGTLHSFLLMLIQRNYKVLGYLTPNLAVIDQEQADDLLASCCERLSYKGPKEKVKEVLDTKIIPPKNRGVPVHELVALDYTMQLMRNGIMTFDSILREGELLFRKPALEWAGYDYLFVDEFQDSSDIDARLYEAMPILNKLYVGDPDQAIYSFRSGNVENIVALNWREGVESHMLETNYRSDKLICHAAQNLIERNVHRIKKLTLPASTERGNVTVIPAVTQDGERDTVLSLLRNAAGTSAILVRTRHLVREWNKYLQGQGVKTCSKVPINRPEDWKKAKLAIALLHDPENDWLAYQFIALCFGQSFAKNESLMATAAGKSLNTNYLKIPRGVSMADCGNVLARMGISAASLSLIMDVAKDLREGFSNLELLGALNEIEGDEVEIGSGVFVGTIHSAKGREFDNVFMSAFEQEIIPGTRKNCDIEEERRLAYVGMTRARHNLVLSFAEKRTPEFGSFVPVPATPSRFIQEAGL